MSTNMGFTRDNLDQCLRAVANLVAMKLMSGRQYKHDVSDIAGILKEQKEMGKELTFARIDEAVHALYGGWNNLPSNAKPLILSLLDSENLEMIYAVYKEEERENRSLLIDFEEDYPEVASEDNIEDILIALKKKV